MRVAAGHHAPSGGGPPAPPEHGPDTPRMCGGVRRARWIHRGVALAPTPAWAADRTAREARRRPPVGACAAKDHAGYSTDPG